MPDTSREVYLRQEQPELCAKWQETHWALYHQKLDQISKGGMLTGTAMRFIAKAVNQELPPDLAAAPSQDGVPRKAGRSGGRPRKGAKKMHEPSHARPEESSVASLPGPPLPTNPEIHQYLVEIRRKFETLLLSKHRQSVSAFVEVLYRDIVFLEDHAEDGL